MQKVDHGIALPGGREIFPAHPEFSDPVALRADPLDGRLASGR